MGKISVINKCNNEFKINVIKWAPVYKVIYYIGIL